MYQIIWSNKARDSYKQITDFMLFKWSIDVILELDDKVQGLLDSLSRQKNLCPKLDTYQNLRKCVISRQTSLIYFIDEDNQEIRVVAFIDNRMNHPF